MHIDNVVILTIKLIVLNLRLTTFNLIDFKIKTYFIEKTIYLV